MTDDQPHKARQRTTPPWNKGAPTYPVRVVARLTTMQGQHIKEWAEENGQSEAAALRYFLSRGMGMNPAGTAYLPKTKGTQEDSNG